MNFKDFTLIITAYERRDTLPFILSFYRETGIKVLLIDSSKKSYKYINNYPWINYHHLPKSNFYEALNYSVIQAGTKYICWNNDDDIILPLAIYKCLEFIKNDKKKFYSSVLGYQSKINSDYGYELYQSWLKYNFSSNKYNDRLDFFFKYFQTPVHAVCRSDILKDSTKVVFENSQLQPIRFFDRIFGIFSSIYGNTKVLPVHFSLRSNKRLIKSWNYPRYLKKNVKPKELLSVLDSYDPISELASKRINVNQLLMHNNLMKVLNYYVK